ncbi:site-specific integrase [Streptomyces sp. WZ-12]|nr:site-specific integrase [Streptomyces sp. WZ-12]
MLEREDVSRDLGSLVVSRVGALVESGDPWEPYRLVDPAGAMVGAAAAYMKDLQAAGRPATTQRSYGMDLLRWFRFLWAVEVPWNEATRIEARDFSRWIQITAKPPRPHRSSASTSSSAVRPVARGTNPITGKRPVGTTYAASTVAHSETVLRSFYAHHLEAGTGPLVNPFPLARTPRVNAHHNPMEPWRPQRAGLFRPRQPQRIPRQIPDAVFNELFARLSSDRDRAMVAFWISTGARASELLGVLCSGTDPGRQLVTVVRKGSRALQQLPASPDAFVWLRLYQQQMHELVPTGPDDPLWWTLRRPFRALNYHAARAMFVRANSTLGSDWSLHDLRHTAAYRLARDPLMPITDVQWVLGHARLSTTQRYVTPTTEDVIESVLAHHRRQAEEPAEPSEPTLHYRPESLDVLFGRRRP